MNRLSIVAVFALFGIFALAMASQRIKVESIDGRYKKHRMNIDRNDEVRLTNRISSDGCVKGKDWGWDSNGIWVDHGCRAWFEVSGRGGGNNNNNGGNHGNNNGNGGNHGNNNNNNNNSNREVVTVESVNDRRKTFNPSRSISDVRLLSQLSDKPCRRKANWDFDRDRLWVDNGCRAVFEVRYR